MRTSRNVICFVDCSLRCPNRRHRTIKSSTPFNIVTSLLVEADISSNRVVRTRVHELFRWTHVIFTLVFVLTAYYHQRQLILPVAILMAILVLQWLVRVFKILLPLPHATAQLLPQYIVRLTIPMPVNPIARRLWKTWTPGSHVRITIPSIGLLQPHPFTITSLPTEKKIQLYIRAKAGFTQRLHEKTAAAAIAGNALSIKVHFEGIYNVKFPNFSKFDVVLLISSGIGVTFTIPILKDIVERVKVIQQRDGDCHCKRIGFVWIVRRRGLSFHSQVNGSRTIVVCERVIRDHAASLWSCCDEILRHERRTKDGSRTCRRSRRQGFGIEDRPE